MAYDEFLLPCVQQQTLLLTKILDITAQIEVQSRQQDIRLDNLPEQRQIYIDRLQKCNRLIAEKSAKLPDLERERLNQILRGICPGGDCREEEMELLQYGKKSADLLQNILVLDTDARKRIGAECDHLRTLLRNSNNRQAASTLHPTGQGS